MAAFAPEIRRYELHRAIEVLSVRALRVQLVLVVHLPHVPLVEEEAPQVTALGGDFTFGGDGRHLRPGHGLAVRAHELALQWGLVERIRIALEGLHPAK